MLKGPMTFVTGFLVLGILAFISPTCYPVLLNWEEPLNDKNHVFVVLLFIFLVPRQHSKQSASVS